MPCWEMFVPENCYTEEDKARLSEAITSMYVDHAGLPKFYVVVIFHEKAPNSIYVGGKAANSFVRIRVDHFARQLDTAEERALCMAVIEEKLAPFVKDRGFDWEVHIDETPMDLWRIQGVVPPPPGSEAERLWAQQNKPIPYELSQ
jgi:phenylpyruvate tautomerase PptA (4-oxalocrotonate tautomerase family)